jgi:hypothetical protein
MLGLILLIQIVRHATNQSALFHQNKMHRYDGSEFENVWYGS